MILYLRIYFYKMRIEEVKHCQRRSRTIIYNYFEL